MDGVNEIVYLDDLKSFRWELYHHRDSKEIIKCLCRYYFKKYYFQHFAEEIVIAGYDLQNLNGDIRQEVNLHIPGLSFMEFPTIREQDDTLWDLNRLFICILYKNTNCFVKGLELVAKKRPNDLCKLLICTGFILWQLESWLDPSIRGNFLLILHELRSSQTILSSSQMNVVENYRDNFKYWKGKRYKNTVDVIDAIMPEPKFRHKKITEHFDRLECVSILIDWDIDITKQSLCGRSALYHAVARNNLSAFYKLLKKGSFIGSATNVFDPSVWNIDSKLLEKHFDNCITRCADDDRYIEIDFKNLVSRNVACQKCDGSCSDEMKAIELIAESNDHKHLLVHPVITTFVLLKWNQLAFIFHFHFMMYVLFAISTTGYIFCIVNDVADGITIAFNVLTLLLASYVGIRRVLHQIHESVRKNSSNPNKMYNYWRSLQTTLIVILILLLLFDESKVRRPIFASTCIMLMALELFILAGSLFWSFSKYYVMFLDVALSSIKSLQLCLILLPAFSMSFYLLLWNHSNKELGKVYKNEVNNTIKEMDDSFGRLRHSIIKIIAMSAGEFEAATSNFDSSIVSSYLFLGFLFLISIVFMNLMNGLAVSDTQKIQSDAEATSMIQRVRLLAHFEGVISNRHHLLRRKCQGTIIMKIFEYLTKINPLEKLCSSFNTKIYIGPNNKVLILKKDYRTSEQFSMIFYQNGTYLLSWVSYFICSKKLLKVDPIIVHRARKILDRKDARHKEENEKTRLRNYCIRLENDLEKVMQIVKQNDDISQTIIQKLSQINKTPSFEINV